MRSMEKTSLVSCQISYLPIDSKDYLNEISQVLDIIKDSGLEHSATDMSTTIKGEYDQVFEVISSIHQKMSNKDCFYNMNIMLSNICGCQFE